jgi:threonine/homoserine/homoserine lactone efflux protein
VSLELYLAFVLATAVLIAIPGPNVTLIVAHAVAHGARTAFATVFGTQCAQAVQLGFVALGMTTLIVTFASVFEWLRWIGVAYLIWLGLQRWRAAAPKAEPESGLPAAPRGLFWQGFAVGLTNPKTWLFYAAFFPQFVNPEAPIGPQLAVLSVTYLTIATLLDGSYALLAGRVRGWLGRGSRRRATDRVAGSLLIGAGVWLALARRG